MAAQRRRNPRSPVLVTAGGRLVRASSEENAELLWALRGGGGNFGVVTSMEFRLHPVGPDVFGGLVMHPAERGPELMRLWRDVMDGAPEELGLAFAYMRAPADDPPGHRNYWTVEQLPDLPDEVVELIHARALEMPGSAPQIFCVAWGGAVARGEDSPLAGRDAGYVVHPLMLWDDPADDERVMGWGRAFRADLRDHATGVAYLNFAGDEGRSRARAQYGDASYRRLAAIKAKWDPANVFEAVGHVAPAND